MTMSSGTVETTRVREDSYELLFYLALNVCGSALIFSANKVVYGLGLRTPTLLIAIQQLSTFLTLELCRSLVAVPKWERVPLLTVLPISLSYCGWIALTNLTLLYSSITDYQFINLLSIPFTVLVQAVFYNETTPWTVSCSLLLTCGGFAISFIEHTDGVNLWRVLAGLFAKCMHNIWIGTKQKELRQPSHQLLQSHAALSAMLLIPLVPILDDLSNFNPRSIFNFVIVVAILISCGLSFFVNLSIFQVIGKTSPVTYNVLAHFKVSVFSSTRFVFLGLDMPSAAVPRFLTGTAVTLVGVLWYGILKGATRTCNFQVQMRGSTSE